MRMMTDGSDLQDVGMKNVKKNIGIIPASDPKQCVCVRSISRKSRDLDALRSREGIVVTVAVVVSE